MAKIKVPSDIEKIVNKVIPNARVVLKPKFQMKKSIMKLWTVYIIADVQNADEKIDKICTLFDDTFGAATSSVFDFVIESNQPQDEFQGF